MTTNYINKNDTNTYTRKLNNQRARHVERAVSSSHLDVTCTSWLKVFLSLTSSHHHTCAFLSDLTFLPFYFDLSFTVLFHFSFLTHPEQHTELDNLNTVQHNLRTSAKGSNDAYDVSVSLTRTACSGGRACDTDVAKYWRGVNAGVFFSMLMLWPAYMCKLWLLHERLLGA